MTNKLKFLTRISLDKKIRTKWFLIANVIFAILIIGLINIDSVIKLFGGDFDDTQEILVIDEVGSFDMFKLIFDETDPRNIALVWTAGYSGQFDLYYGKHKKTIVVESLF